MEVIWGVSEERGLKYVYVVYFEYNVLVGGDVL